MPCTAVAPLVADHNCNSQPSAFEQTTQDKRCTSCLYLPPHATSSTRGEDAGEAACQMPAAQPPWVGMPTQAKQGIGLDSSCSGCNGKCYSSRSRVHAVQGFVHGWQHLVRAVQQQQQQQQQPRAVALPRVGSCAACTASGLLPPCWLDSRLAGMGTNCMCAFGVADVSRLQHAVHYVAGVVCTRTTASGLMPR
jgi:hypothetical protein